MTAAQRFLNARDFLLRHRNDYERAYRGFAWPSDVVEPLPGEFGEEDFPELR